jgi:hypothetical protein
MQGTRLRQNLQSTILTMTAGPYKEASVVFKSFQPPEFATKKRSAPNDATGESPTNRTRSNGNGNTMTTINNRIPRNPPTGSPSTTGLLDNSPAPTTTQGKTILKQLATDSSAKLLHPGPIFPHPTRPNKFTLLCCRSAYEGKTCTYQHATSSIFQTISIILSAQRLKQKWLHGYTPKQPLNGRKKPQRGQLQQQVTQRNQHPNLRRNVS